MPRTPEERAAHAATQRAWYARNKAKATAAKRAKTAADPGPNRARAATWRAKNRDRVLARSTAYYRENREKVLEGQRRAKAKDPVRYRRYGWLWQLRKYGLTAEDFDALVIAQSGLCAICDDQLERAHIDHCHVEGHVRGILCGNCNRGLGMFKDDPTLLERAAEYLRR